MITDYEAAVFSKIAYRPEDDEVVIELLGSLNSSVGWRRSDRLYDDVTGLGLSVFSHITGENTVIAFRGTKVPENIISDIQILLGWPVSIEAQAQKIYLEKRAEHSTITLTGHSLGGALAIMLSLEYGLNTIVFDSPGCHRMTKEKPFFSRHKELVRNIVGRPNLVRSCAKITFTLYEFMLYYLNEYRQSLTCYFIHQRKI